MKHHEAYTGRGGQKMSQTNLGKAVRCLMAVLLVAHSFALLACSSGEPQVKNLNNTPVVCNATNITAVTGRALTFTPASVFDGRFPPSVASVTMTFTSATAFSLSSTPGPSTGTASAAGTVGAFGAGGAVTLTYSSSGYPVFQGPQAGQIAGFTACSIQVTAGGVEVGADRVNAAVTVTLASSRGTVVSQTLTSQ